MALSELSPSNRDSSSPEMCLPAWELTDLPEPAPLSLRHWAGFIGPGIVMMGVQIGGGEWLYGPEITARYGGGLMWIASVAIILQVFYNLECGRYALFCGEPVTTGFMRKLPGPMFWMSVILVLNLAALIPGLSTHGATILASVWLGHPPGEANRGLVMALAYACIVLVVFPILVGGKIYNTLQAIMTVKVIVVLGFCLLVGVLFVDPAHWWSIWSGFAQFGNVPVEVNGREGVANVLTQWWRDGTWPAIAMANIATVGAFAGYAGGGGLANSTYSNFVRDKGWGMGSKVGAIASAIGGRNIALSHLGKTFAVTGENLARWRGWWRYILTDQLVIWAPGCFMGMALPALLSLQFAPHSPIYNDPAQHKWTQAVLTADGMRNAPSMSAAATQLLWFVALFVGLMVLLPSQMAIVDDFTRRWTDILWSASARVRRRFRADQAKTVYYTILAAFVVWTLIMVSIFAVYGTPTMMTHIIANLNNLAIGVTSFQLLWVNRTLLPRALRPRWYHQAGLLACGTFYLGLAWLVFVSGLLPALRQS